MGSRTKAEIRYSYRGLSPALIRHVFRYVSALTDIAFCEDVTSPHICYMQGGETPASARIIIQGSGTYLKRGNDESRALTFDPVKKLSEMLSLSFKSGPYSQERLSPAPPDQPTLSETIGMLIKTLEDTGLIPMRSKPITLWPGDHPFAVALTHDIDIVRRTIPGGIRLLWKRHLPGGLGALLDSAKSVLMNSPNPYDRIREWIMLEKELGLKSTFFIFDGWRMHASDPKYKLPMISADLDAIKSNGLDLALHTGIGCHSGQHVYESKKALEDAAGIGIRGLRPHYLSASFPRYWQAAAESGFAYSSAFGFDEEIGYLRGIDLPIVPFDKESDRAMDIVEIPIAIMDCGLVGALDAHSEEVFEKGRSLINRCARSGGLLVLDWHERTLYDRDYPGWGPLYFKLIDYARSRGAHFPSMSDIAANLTNRFQDRP